MVDNKMNDKNSYINNNIVNIRMPCRGCVVDCKNYDRCNGKLWRMDGNNAADSKAKKR